MPHGKPDFSQVGAPVLGHFGTSDDFIPLEDAKALEAELQAAGVEAAFEYYEGGGHAFANDPRGIAVPRPTCWPAESGSWRYCLPSESV
jgi:dienelactone hydrolase